jgi:N-acetylglucosamine kinase-like BadF-type ATPase
MGLDQPQQLIPALYRGSWDRTALAALAPLVLEAAEEDAVAAQLRAEAAAGLAEIAAAVARNLNMKEGRVPLSLAGSVLLGNAPYREIVLDKLKSCGILADPIRLVPEPAEGAVRRASCASSQGS